MSYRPNVLRIETDNPLSSKASTRWIIARPGETLTERGEYRYSYPARGAGLGFLAGLALGSTELLGGASIAIGWLLVPLGLLLGLAWRRFIVPLTSRLGRQLRSGRAVELQDDPLNRQVVQLAQRGSDVYWELAHRAAQRDALRHQLSTQPPGAQRSVMVDEFDRATQTLTGSVSAAALTRALASLQRTDSAAELSGLVNSHLYLAIQRGKATLMSDNS